MKASLCRFERINVAKTLLCSAEERFSTRQVQASGKPSERAAFRCPVAFLCEFPELSSEFTDREWELLPPTYARNPSLVTNSHARAAVHEAGHFVVAMQFVKKGYRVTAHLDDQGNGTCTWDARLRSGLPEKLASAAIMHAGAMAELALSGEAWTGPIRHAHEFDWQQADALLASRKFPSGAHAFAQVYALAKIWRRWDHLRTVAQALHEKGRYTEEVTA